MAFLIQGDRGGMLLAFRNFRYDRHQTRGDNIHWRYWRQRCRAKVKTNIFDVAEENPHIFVLEFQDHNHPDDSAMINRSRMRARLVEQCLEDSTWPCHRTYNAEVVRLRRQAQGGGDRPELPPFGSVRSSMQRARAASLPAIPRTVDAVQIQGAWAQTWTDERFLLHADNHWGVLVFATDKNLIVLQRCSMVYMDGTFRSCPRPYEQVFTIFGKTHRFVLPLIHVLMEQKTVGHYRQVFQTVKTAVRHVSHHRFCPEQVICDFEQALKTAIETEFPEANIGGCYFHFNQSLWRRIQHLGLAGPYQADDRFAQTIRKVMALGYLPVALVQLNFQALVNQRGTRRLITQHPELEEFLEYVRNTYIRPGCPFPPVVWNVFHRDMDQRTNNHVESFHRTLNAAVQIRHPTLWLFIRHLKDSQTTAEATIARAARGDAPPRRRRKWRILEQRLVRMSSGDALNWFTEAGIQALKISPGMAQKWTEEIVRCYSDNGRYYHTLQHIADMMNHFHTWREQLKDHAAVVMAILFHDIIYDPQSSSNEVDSIELFKKFAEEVVLNEDLSNKVSELIRATIKHLPEEGSPASSDLLFFLDFDMAILGQSQEVYDVYATNIRKEYCHMSTEDFCKGRTKVLQTFMARPRIYFTEELHKSFEDQARQNMLREIESLQQQLANPAQACA